MKVLYQKANFFILIVILPPKILFFSSKNHKLFPIQQLEKEGPTASVKNLKIGTPKKNPMVLGLWVFGTVPTSELLGQS